MTFLDEASRQRLFDATQAFAHPLTVAICSAVIALLAISFIVIRILASRGTSSDETITELKQRWTSWLWLVLAILVPILAGGFWTILAVCLLSLSCYREFARATGVFRERLISIIVVLAILMLTFASLDHFERLYFACGPLGTALIVVATIQTDRPHGFVQRVALGVLGFLLFGFSLGYLGLMANSAAYRPLLLLIILAVQLNDIFAFCCGRLIGGPKWLPETSPNKTLSGSIGALLLTTILVVGLGLGLFRGTPLDDWSILATLGFLISGLGQLGDLTLSSIKRDIGLKDISGMIPGHGGLLDRFDSLVLVPPAVYHFLSLYLGPIGADQPVRILTGSG